MKRICCAVILACLLAALFPCVSLGQAGDDSGAKLDEMLKRYDTLGACIAVIQNGAVTYVHCYGQARPGAPISPPVRFFRWAAFPKWWLTSA